MEAISDIMEENQLTWFRHLIRIDQNRTVKTIWEAKCKKQTKKKAERNMEPRRKVTTEKKHELSGGKGISAE